MLTEKTEGVSGFQPLFRLLDTRPILGFRGCGNSNAATQCNEGKDIRTELPREKKERVGTSKIFYCKTFAVKRFSSVWNTKNIE